MTTMLLHGCNGRMGQVIASLVKDRTDCEITTGIDINVSLPNPFPVFSSFEELPETTKADVIIDFSHPSALRNILSYALRTKTPVVIATTGISQNDLQYLKDAASFIPVFHSANMSIGICLLKDLVKRAAAFLGEDFDIEIVERHHNQKLDAPSGTALALADAINDAAPDKFSYIYDRHSRSAKRGKHEIGISAVRGGSIIGDHEVLFAGNNELIEINHKAISRNIFADGAIRAGLFLKDKPAGLYEMNSMLEEIGGVT